MKNKHQKPKPEAEPRTAEHVNGPQVGEVRIDFEAMKAKGMTALHALGENPHFELINRASITVASAAELLDHMRDIRDTCAFKTEGFHSFREWTMAKFGEKLGGWLEEML